MLAIRIKDIKTFMAKLLNSDTFDFFLLEEAQIQTYNTFLIDGHQNTAFYSKEELEDAEIFPYEYSQWKMMKPICFQLIKGKKVPTFMKITFLLTPKASHVLLEKEDILKFNNILKAFVLTIKYDSNGLLLTTGTSFHTFLMDKTMDILWDNTVRKFLYTKGMDYDEI